MIRFAILLISAVGLAYEIVLMRIFSIAEWHHFAYMMISIAMLGFGASGTLLTLLRPLIQNREKVFLRFFAFGLTVSLVGCTVLSQKIPFETFLLTTQPKQFFYLSLLYLLLSLPFFLVASCITLGFFLNPNRIGQIYGFSMLGSGLGAMAVIGLLFLFPPEKIPHLLVLPAGLAFLFLGRFTKKQMWMNGISVVLFAFLFLSNTSIRLSEYKGLSYALKLPDASVLATAQSPLSVLTVVSSSSIRETPGQISNYPMHQLGPLPKQHALFFDGGSLSAIPQFTGDLQKFRYLDYVTSALPYHLILEPDVLVVGAGGGSDVLNALLHQSKKVVALEVEPRLFPLIKKYFNDFTGKLYERPNVVPVIAEARGYMQSHLDCYDLIHVALLDSFTASSAGVHALSENYLYTVEALSLYIHRLKASGMVAITRWIKTPPRDAIKMFATMIESCKKAGIQKPEDHLCMIRSWNTATLLLSKAPFSQNQIQAIRRFAKERHFDLCYYPGIQEKEANQYMVLKEPFYFQAAQKLLFSNPEKFYKEALFYLRPATDDSPYFFRFFKWRSLPVLINEMGYDWIPFVEWGVLVLWGTLVQGALISCVLILLPLFIFRRIPKRRGAKRWVFFYFAGLGLAFMFLEIAYIQKFMLFLAYPIYAVAVVLAAFLIFSGCGSYFADGVLRRRGRDVIAIRLVGMAVLFISLLSILYFLFLPSLFSQCADWPDEAKIGLSVVLLAPLAFAMGIPFPTGLQCISQQAAAFLPWAWGINGCASVMGALLATLCAIHFGFHTVVGLAVVLYVLCAFSLKNSIRVLTEQN